MAEIKITWTRSGIGRPGVQRRTLEALGLRHHQDVIIKEDNPAIRGMINRVSHLVEVQEADDA